tara:strand:+ start:1254 stop:1424 length:171 start_codon:yes stop_codon:yes gene_type:complete
MSDYMSAISFIRTEIEVHNTPVDEALAEAFSKFTLGLNQIAEISKKVEERYPFNFC